MGGVSEDLDTVIDGATLRYVVQIDEAAASADLSPRYRLIRKRFTVRQRAALARYKIAQMSERLTKERGGQGGSETSGAPRPIFSGVGGTGTNGDGE